MKPFHIRIAQLWYKQKNNECLTQCEVAEWKESHTANMYQHNPAIACEYTMARLWKFYLKNGHFLPGEIALWQYALEENLERYLQKQQLSHLTEIIRFIGDEGWADELQHQLQKIAT